MKNFFLHIILIISLILPPIPVLSQVQPPASTFQMQPWEAMTFQIQNLLPSTIPSEKNITTINVVRVPENFEYTLVKKLASEESQTPTLIVYNPNSGTTDGRRLHDLATTSSLTKINPLASFYPLSPDNRNQENQFAQPYTLDQVAHAGYWVTIFTATVPSVSFFISSSLGAAMSAFTLSVLMSAFYNGLIFSKIPQLYSQFLNAAGEQAQQALTNLAKTQSQLVDKISFFVGKMMADLAACLVNNSALQAVLNLGDFTKTFGTMDSLEKIIAISTVSSFSSGPWHAFTAYIRSQTQNPSDQNEKLARLVSYNRQIIIALTTPFLYFPSTSNKAIFVFAALGAVGLTANIFNEKAVEITQKIVTMMENSPALTKFLNQFLRAEEAVKIRWSKLLQPWRQVARSVVTTATKISRKFRQRDAPDPSLPANCGTLLTATSTAGINN